MIKSWGKWFKFLTTGILFILLAHQFGDRLINRLIPLYQWEINHLDSRLHTTYWGIVDIHGEKFLQLDVIISEPFFIGLNLYSPKADIQNSSVMSLGNILQPMVIVLTIVLAWPTRNFKLYFVRLAISLPLILALMMLDIPIQFTYEIWDGIYRSVGPNATSKDLFSYWSDFLNGGGLIAISIIIGIIAVALSENLIKQGK